MWCEDVKYKNDRLETDTIRYDTIHDPLMVLSRSSQNLKSPLLKLRILAPKAEPNTAKANAPDHQSKSANPVK